MTNFGTHALNILRLEKGFRAWSAEISVDTTMIEAGMMDFVDWKKVKLTQKLSLNLSSFCNLYF